MKITKSRLKEIIADVLKEESEYQKFFAKALKAAGKSIPQMSDEEKKAFFNKIEKSWKGKGEKSEAYDKDGNYTTDVTDVQSKTADVDEAAPKMKKNPNVKAIQSVFSQTLNLKKGGMQSRYMREFESARKRALKALRDMEKFSKIGV